MKSSLSRAIQKFNFSFVVTIGLFAAFSPVANAKKPQIETEVVTCKIAEGRNIPLNLKFLHISRTVEMIEADQIIETDQMTYTLNSNKKPVRINLYLQKKNGTRGNVWDRIELAEVKNDKDLNRYEFQSNSSGQRREVSFNVNEYGEVVSVTIFVKAKSPNKDYSLEARSCQLYKN